MISGRKWMNKCMIKFPTHEKIITASRQSIRLEISSFYRQRPPKTTARTREITQISWTRAVSLFLARFPRSPSFTPCSQHGSRQEQEADQRRQKRCQKEDVSEQFLHRYMKQTLFYSVMLHCCKNWEGWSRFWTDVTRPALVSSSLAPVVMDEAVFRCEFTQRWDSLNVIEMTLI